MIDLHLSGACTYVCIYVGVNEMCLSAISAGIQCSPIQVVFLTTIQLEILCVTSMKGFPSFRHLTEQIVHEMACLYDH